MRQICLRYLSSFPAKKPKWQFCLLLVGIVSGLSIAIKAKAAETRSIVFPVLGSTSYRDDFGDPRSGGRTHEGNDIFAPKMRPLVAAVAGTIRSVAYPEPSYGYAIVLEDEEGYGYWYLHINNDTPGTDDHNGGGFYAYAPDMQRRLPVTAGQLIGWVGDSGNAETTSPHLHFEIHQPDGTPISPYQSLRNATRIGKPVIPPAIPGETLPFGQFRGGGSIAMRPVDVPAESFEFTTEQNIVAAAGPGGGPFIRVMNLAGNTLHKFYAYEERFSGGVNVALGDVDGDDITDIVTAPGKGRKAFIRVYTLDGALKEEFEAYPGFINGVRISVADLDGDGSDEIITGPQAGGRPWVRVFRPDGTLVSEFFAFSKSFRGGIEVAATAATPEIEAAIFVIPGATGGPMLRHFRLDGSVVNQFWTYRQEFRGGVNLTVGEMDSTSPGPEILAVPASKAGPDFRLYSSKGLLLRDDLTAFEEWWRGGYDASISGGQIVVMSVGGRRTSVRMVDTQREFDWWDNQSQATNRR